MQIINVGVSFAIIIATGVSRDKILRNKLIVGVESWNI